MQIPAEEEIKQDFQDSFSWTAPKDKCHILTTKKPKTLNKPISASIKVKDILKHRSP